MKKTILTMGLCGLAYFTKSQNLSPSDFRSGSNWVVVSKTNFESFDLESSKVQVVDKRDAKWKYHHPEPDTSFDARIYIDHAGGTHYWLSPRIYIPEIKHNGNNISDWNNNYENRKQSTKFNSLNDKLVIEILSGFSADFIIKPPYAIDPITKKEASMYGFGVKDKTLIEGQYDLVLKNIKTNKEYLIADSTKYKKSLSQLLIQLYQEDAIKDGLNLFLRSNGREGIEQNVNFLKKYFSSLIPNAHKIYPEYESMTPAIHRSMSEAIDRFGVKDVTTTRGGDSKNTSKRIQISTNK